MTITKRLDKLGTLGLFLIALFSPCCFPLFAFIAAALGLGSFELFGSSTMWIFQGMVLLTIVGLILSYRIHKNIYPLLVSLASGALVFYGYHFNTSDNWLYFLYTGMFGLLIATYWNHRQNKLHNSCSTCVSYEGKMVELESTITCPHCGHKKIELMPTDACQYFYACEKCQEVIKPLKGDCCVYCSYGTVKCPPIQAGINCC